MKEIIVGESIRKSFQTGTEKQMVLNGISVAVKEGEFVSIMGPSGSGKSTLLYTLSGMEQADSGKVLFDGRELNQCTEQELAEVRRNQMGFVFQQANMLKNLTVLDNIMLVAMYRNHKHKKQVYEKAMALMEQMGIVALAEREVSCVSGGELQRAGICRALINTPKLILGDEPTGALNSKTADEVMEIFKNINQNGTTVMLVTHDAKVAAKTERILFMSDGRVAGELKLPKYTGGQFEERLQKVTEHLCSIGI